MCADGARRFLLLSRSGKLSAEQEEELTALQSQYSNCVVVVARCDVTNRKMVEGVYTDAKISNLLIERAAILHFAMLLNDAPVLDMTDAQLTSTLACKVDGARNLIEPLIADVRAQFYMATEPFTKSIPQNVPLDFVVLFSSISATFGNADQANYAAANAFLDAYCLDLINRGIYARVVNLSGVEDVGVLAQDLRKREITRQRGLRGGLTADVRILSQNVALMFI